MNTDAPQVPTACLATPALPRDDEGIVFAEPWEAKAFALVVSLYLAGHFSWPEWVATLSAEIAADKARAQETPYYQLWLSAAESLSAQKGLLETPELAAHRKVLHAANPRQR